MDGFSYRPYPNPRDVSVPFAFTYGWPNAGVQELARIKQALWDAFDGTAQPTTVEGLRLYLDEVGWQSALRRADGSERPANAAVAAAIAAGCSSGMRTWEPLRKPEGAAVEFAPVNPKAKGQTLVVRYTPTAAEDVTVKAGFFPASTPAAQVKAGAASRTKATPKAEPGKKPGKRPDTRKKAPLRSPR